MKKHYLRIAKSLNSFINSLNSSLENKDLAILHELVVDLKTSLPETLAYENSKLLLDGLRVTSVDDMESYVTKLVKKLDEIKNYYLTKSRR